MSHVHVAYQTSAHYIFNSSIENTTQTLVTEDRNPTHFGKLL
jgi:hypothetical protein